MFLSKINLDTFSRAAFRYEANPNALHGALCQAAHMSRRDGQLLYRQVNDRGRNAVYTYSAVPIDGSALPKGLKLAGQRNLTDWLASLEPGTVLAFDLLAVPAKKVHNSTSHNSKRVILRDQKERLAWVRKRLDSADCTVLELCEGNARRSRIHKGREQRTFFLSGYSYTGLLEVRNPQILKSLLERGVGSEKAYGYGMLMVSRP